MSVLIDKFDILLIEPGAISILHLHKAGNDQKAEL